MPKNVFKANGPITRRCLPSRAIAVHFNDSLQPGVHMLVIAGTVIDSYSVYIWQMRAEEGNVNVKRKANAEHVTYDAFNWKWWASADVLSL